MEVTSFNEIGEDFIQLTHSVVYCSAATIDRRGRPRSRMLHAIWELVDGRPVGWIATVPDSHKAKHLALHPYISLTYILDPHKPVYVDCRVEWVDDMAAKQRLWDWFGSAPPPLGYDLTLFYGTVDSPTYGVMKLIPWRVELGDMTGTARVWRASDSE